MRALEPPSPPLTDGSVVLHPWTPGDAAELLEIARDPDVDRWTYLSGSWSEADAVAWIEARAEAQRTGSGLALAVGGARDGRIVGGVGLGGLGQEPGAELYYWLAGGARGSGYASAAVSLLAEWAFGTLGVPRIFLHVEPSNVASRRVAERVGFVHEGTLRQAGERMGGGGRVDLCVYGLLPRDLGPR